VGRPVISQLKPKEGAMSLETIVRLLRSNQMNREYFFTIVGMRFPKFTPGYELIRKAYVIAKEAHREDVRISGERYFEHPRAVALIMLEYLRIGDANAIAAGLVHDVPEDHGDRWPIERLGSELNGSIAGRVQWGNKRRFDSIGSETERERRYHNSLLLDAPRELAEWKLPDGLHNLLTLWDASLEKVTERIADARVWRLPLAEKHGILIHEYEAALSALEQGQHLLPPPRLP
jgi:(p)ppGpp synthase/HD superfamily hydrolase